MLGHNYTTRGTICCFSADSVISAPQRLTLFGRLSAQRRTASRGFVEKTERVPLRRLLRSHVAELMAAGLLIAMAANLLSVITRKSITIDETSAIPAGYYHLTSRDFHLNSEHPPLPKMLAAVPLLFVTVAKPPPDDIPTDTFSQRTVLTSHFFWKANRDNFGQIFFWARVPMIVITLLLGVLIFAYSRWLFGARAAVLAVALFTLEPNILAHGRIIKDIHAAFAYLLFFTALHLYAARPQLWRAVLVGFATGLAPAMKFSMGIVVPIAVVAAAALILIAPRRGQSRILVFGQLMVAALIGLLLVNASYLFQHDPITTADTEWLIRTAPSGAALILKLIGVLSPVLPPYFLFGILAMLAHDAGDHHVFLLGRYSTTGWWYYFPVTFALKTTLPFLAITLASLTWAVWSSFRREWKFLILLVPIALYTLTAMVASTNIGIRHFLPVFPFLFILGGALLDRFLAATRHRGLAVTLVLVLFAGMILEAIRAYPDYVPYMNQLTAHSPKWRSLSDSNIEWGDDTGALAGYLKARGETRVRAALLGGSEVLPLYGVEYVDLLAPPHVEIPDTRYVALGASFLNGTTVPGWSEGSGRETKEQQRTFFAAYRDRAPEAVFGGTIYLYRVTE